MHHSQEHGRWNIAGEAPYGASLEVDHKCIPKTLCHKRDPLVIRRDVRPLAKIGQDFDIPGKVIERVTWFALSAGVETECKEQHQGFHSAHAITELCGQ